MHTNGRSHYCFFAVFLALFFSSLCRNPDRWCGLDMSGYILPKNNAAAGSAESLHDLFWTADCRVRGDVDPYSPFSFSVGAMGSTVG